jgi:hypothetical protein
MNTTIPWSKAVFFLCASLQVAASKGSAQDEVSLAKKWGGTGEYLPLTAMIAPAGYVVLDAPDIDSKVLRRVDKPTIVMVKISLKLRGRTFYVSDWGFHRMAEGKSPNWVYITPTGAHEMEAANPMAYWEHFYQEMRNDGILRNCGAAYEFFLSKVQNGDPYALRFLEEKVRKPDTDVQARGCVAALLCSSRAFTHDESFARHLIALLQDHQEHRPNARDDVDLSVDEQPDEALADKAKRELYDFIGYPGEINHDWIEFLIRNAPKYEKLLAETMFDSKKDLMLRWISAHALARHKLIAHYYPKFDQSFFRQMFIHLRADHRRWNLLWATRTLLILETVAQPHISQRLSENGLDDQERDVLRMINSGVRKAANIRRFHDKYGDLACDIFYPDEPRTDQFNYELEMFRNL